MQQLIASYLFQNRLCPLPGFGCLSVQTTAAGSDFTNHLITAPAATILFSDKELNAAGLVSYVAERKGLAEQEATAILRNFCSGIKNSISQNGRVSLPGIGDFFVDEHGNTLFEQERLPAVFARPVNAVRLIHPNAEHSMLVGDRETTNTQMVEYLTGEEPMKDRWWIWAIVIAALSLLTLIIYAGNNSTFFGNATKI